MASKGLIASGVTEKVLTHEVGAGAPCLKCGDKCPGLDLHFWRKICRNCKCPQDTHDVNVRVSAKGIDNIGKLLMQDNKENYRRPHEKKESPPPSPEKQKQTITTKVGGAPPPAPKPAKQSTPAVKQAPAPEPQQNGSIPNKDTVPVHDDVGAKQSTITFSVPAIDDSFPEPPPPPYQEEDFPSPPPAIPPLPAEFQEAVTLTDNSVPPTSAHESPQKKTENTYEFAAEAVTPAPVKVDVNQVPPPAYDEIKYDWKPPVADEKLLQDYIVALPEDKRPIAGSEGAKYRKKQLMRQLPAHDQEPNECHDLTPQETDEMQLFVKQYREKALGEAMIEEESEPKSCVECREALKVGDAVIFAERAGEEKKWHPGCFVCAECKELLVDLIYFYNDDKIYCGRHYCELHKPRCAACDELIFAPEYTQAEDSYWHLKHFCCWHCDQPLGGKNYVPHDNQPVCIPCYEKSFAHTCSTCKDIIAPNTEWVTFEEHHWHARPECFKCTQCGESLVGKPCIPKGEMVFCCSKCKREKLSAQ